MLGCGFIAFFDQLFQPEIGDSGEPQVIWVGRGSSVDVPTDFDGATLPLDRALLKIFLRDTLIQVFTLEHH